ncbi:MULTISPECIES: hypothetical protein [unclassified Leucobacter]|uniref:hypothetical protein n=1 Tax=unclassified Leucobacter TaxID=2621730 RepID=UPI000ACF324F|nr:hypothetical protein [Leucobacter sp. Ag1]
MVEGSIPNDTEPRRIALALIAAVEGISQSWLAGLLGTDDAERLLDEILDAHAGPQSHE